jgi:tRNA G37 N-methylase Trm5
MNKSVTKMSVEFICEEASFFLEKIDKIDHIITTLPDMSEMNVDDINEYKTFVKKIIELILSKLQGYAIFIQTDRKYKGEWIDKGFLIQEEAQKYSVKLAFHKIGLHKPIGKKDLYRPTYYRMICYRRKNLSSYTNDIPDVIDFEGKDWNNGTPTAAVEHATDFIKNHSLVGKENVVIDPFCGHGKIGFSCFKKGIDYIGIDIDDKRVKDCLKKLN